MAPGVVATTNFLNTSSVCLQAPSKNLPAQLKASVSAPETLSLPALDTNLRAAVLVQSLRVHQYSRDSIGNDEPFDAAIRTEGRAAWSHQAGRLIHGSGLMEVKIEGKSARIRGDVALRAAGRSKQDTALAPPDRHWNHLNIGSPIGLAHYRPLSRLP